MGPTASGKTALAVEIIQHFPGALISVDSTMVYRGLNIGTAKPDAALQALAPHRLIDIRDPAEAYSAGDFKNDALREIEAIIQQGKIPLLVGGTMLYFYVLQHGLDELPAADASLRLKIQQEAAQQGWPALHEQLKMLDPKAAARIHAHDSQRIQRALEVHALSGKTLSAHHQARPSSLAYPVHCLVLCPVERSRLHQRIEKRFLAMLQAGFIDEVRELYQRPELSLDKPALRAVGYRQIWEYLSGQSTLQEMQEKAIIATRQLAKRQMTWLRRWDKAAWFDSEDEALTVKVLEYLKHYL
jgi:tRNA dimethylallyltransferase